MNIPIAKPYFDEEERAAILGPLDTGWVVQGPNVKAFERAIADFTGAEFGLATTSCTTALHLSLLACGVQSGDEVIVPAFTFVATANAVEYIGARPVFVDIDLDTFNLNIDQVHAAITNKTRAVMPVHLFGLAADMDSIMSIATAHDLAVIEDAACAIGCYYKGKHVGTIGDTGCLSFHPRKSITTGEGGMVLTHRADLAESMGILRDHGAQMSDRARHESGGFLLPEFNMVGFNYRMTDMQGAMGLAQASKLPRILQTKRELAARYDRAFAGSHALRPPIVPAGYQHGYQAYVTLFDPEPAKGRTPEQVDKLHQQRNQLMRSLQSAGIATRQGTHAVHPLGYYANKYGIKPWDFPNAWIADRLSLALPLYPAMTEAEQDYVMANTDRCLGELL